MVERFRINIFSRTRKSGLLEKSLDDSQHIFPIDLSEGQHKKPSLPESNSKNRHANEPSEDTQHLKFFPNRENEENKNSPENKEHKKSKNNKYETQERSDDPDKSSSLDVKPIKPKNQDWHSGLVLGETDIIKKLYSSVPEAKVYEVGNSIGRFMNQNSFSILDIMQLHWNLLHFLCDRLTHKKTNLIIAKSESRISLKDYQVRVSQWPKNIGL